MRRKEAAIHSFAIEPRIKHSYPKLYFRRELAGYRSPYSDPFEYRSFLDAPIPDEVYSVIASTAHDKDCSDPVMLGKREFEYLVRWADEAFDARRWSLAYRNGTIAGFVFPQMYPDAKNLGSVWHLGVLPKYRGKGFGKILHARALETLRVLGATRYTGSTEPDNEAMLRIFRANGCEFSGFRIIEEFENGTGRALA